MSQETLRKIWITLAILALVVLINVHGSTQNSAVSLVIKLPIELKFSDVTSRESYAVHGLRFFGLFFWVIPFLALYHAKRSHTSAAEAFPFRLLDIDPKSLPGKWVQGIAILVFLGLPLITAVHLWRIVLDTRICQKAIPNEGSCAGIWSRPVSAALWDDTYQIAGKGPTYDPLVEPALALILTSFSAYLVIRLLIEMKNAKKRRA